MPTLKNTQFDSKSMTQVILMILLATGLFAIGFAVIFLLPKYGENSSLATEFSSIPKEVDYPAPQLALTDLSSNIHSLDDFRKVIVLVNNWATWCPPCKAEMPSLQNYFQTHVNQGFVVIAIESGESINEVSDFVKQYSLTFPVWIDPDGLALEKFKNWDLPSSYVIDRNGRVRLTWTGPISLENLEKYVTPLLDQ